MNNHDLSVKIAKRLLDEFQIGHSQASGDFEPATEEEVQTIIEHEIEANGD